MNPLYMLVENLFAYKYLELNLDELTNALFVGKNSSGKTSIFDIMCWIIFGQIPRKGYKSIMRDVPKKQNYGRGEFVFKKGKYEYKIIRELNSKGEETVDLKIHESDIGLKGKTLIQQHIIDILGVDFKTFLNVVYFSQGDIGKVLNATSTERIEIVSKAMNLSEIDNLIKQNDKEIGQADREISEKQGRLKTLEEYMSGVDLQELNKKKKEIEKELKIKGKRQDELKSYIEKCEVKKEIEEKINKLKNDFQIKKETAKKLLEQNNNQIKWLNEKKYDIEGTKKKIKELEDDLETLKSSDKRLKELNDEIEQLNNKVTKYEEKRKHLKNKKDELGEVLKKENSECPICMRVIDENVSKIIQETIDGLDVQIVSVDKNVLSVRNELEIRKKEKSNLELERDELIPSKNKKEQLEKELHQKERDEQRKMELQNKNKEIKSELKEQTDNIKIQLRTLKQNIETYEYYNTALLSKIESELDGVNEEIYNKQTEINSLKYEVKRYEDAKVKLNKTKKELEKYQKEYEVKSYWKKALPKIKIRMIGKAIPFLETKANEYLSQISPDHHMYFKADPTRKQNKLDIKIEDTKNKKIRPIEGWGGGEKDKMSLSVYLALNKLVSLKSEKELNFIILDEKLIFVDTETRPIIFDMLRNEYKDRKIWMISHLQDIKSEFEQIVNVKKVGGISEISEISRN